MSREDLLKLAAEIAEETPAVAIEWTPERQAEYAAWWDTLTPEEQEFWKASPAT